MTTGIADLSPRAAAKIAGAGYLAIFVLAIFAEFFVRSRLVIPGDAAATAGNIIASEGLFRLGIAGYLAAALFDVVVALALYVLLRPVHAGLALLAAWFRLVHATILGIALGNLLGVLPLLGGADYLSAFDASQRQAEVMLLLEAFNQEWLIGLVFFGLHCLLLGYLIVKSGFLPRVLGVLLMIAAFGYLIDSFAHFLLPSYADYEIVFLMVVAVPAMIAELSLCLWLLLKDIDVPRAIPGNSGG